MEIIRYRHRKDGTVRVGVRRDRWVTPVAGGRMADLWARPAAELRARLDRPDGEEVAIEDVVPLSPVDGRTEVWAAGVTYERSRSARQEESTVAEVYGLVYQADRPELFFKSVAWRVVTDSEAVAIRGLGAQRARSRVGRGGQRRR